MGGGFGLLFFVWALSNNEKPQSYPFHTVPSLLSFSHPPFCINFGVKMEEEALKWAFFIDI